MKCKYCKNSFHPDSRGACSSCGAPAKGISPRGPLGLSGQKMIRKFDTIEDSAIYAKSTSALYTSRIASTCVMWTGKYIAIGEK